MLQAGNFHTYSNQTEPPSTANFVMKCFPSKSSSLSYSRIVILLHGSVIIILLHTKLIPHGLLGRQKWLWCGASALRSWRWQPQWAKSSFCILLKVKCQDAGEIPALKRHLGHSEEAKEIIVISQAKCIRWVSHIPIWNQGHESTVAFRTGETLTE